jgi:putative FmdB family regulatory protein
MPVYEYECLECGTRFDLKQRFGDSQPSACPNGHGRVHRLFSQPSIIFKGSGFYATDHGRNTLSRPSRNGRNKHKPEPASSTEPTNKDES